MPYRWVVLIGTLALLGYAGAADAATRYVSDQLSINMRRGPGPGYRISRLLDAGDKLQILSTSQGWSKIRTDNGRTGYVLTRFLSDRPPARTRIATIQKQNHQLKTENANLKAKLKQVAPFVNKPGGVKKNLLAQNQALQSQLQKIKQTSADAIRIGKQNRQYRARLISLHSDIDRLRGENDALQNRRDGMKIGALILLAGVILGLLLPLFRRGRNNGRDSF